MSKLLEFPSSKSAGKDPTACVDSQYGENVYKFYNGELVGEDAREYKAHLLLCSHCRGVITKLDWIGATLQEEFRGGGNLKEAPPLIKAGRRRAKRAGEGLG